MTDELHILGAGGHGLVVSDAAFESGKWSHIYIYDDLKPVALPFGSEYKGDLQELANIGAVAANVVVAIGDARLRLDFMDMLKNSGADLATVVHPRSVVSSDAIIGPGTVVLGGAIVNPGVVIGLGSIINTGSIIDHHCRLGIGVHICPGATLAGRVIVGDRTWIGVGASVRDGTSIGSDVLVGAGGVVVNNIPDNTTAVGCPARPRRFIEANRTTEE